MKKATLKQLKTYVATGAAIDLTRKEFDEIDTIRDTERGFDCIAYSAGVNGCNGALFKGNASGKLYVVTARTTALFQVF